MLLPATPKRFAPRSTEATSAARRHAELRALVRDLIGRIERIQKDQDIQLHRIAQLQQEIDELRRSRKAQ